MAFPRVIVECAFNSVLSEQSSAQTGFTDITKFVESVSGTLRGRSYELESVETGSITLTLDNADLRFTPGSALSPYAPYVKANRRLRIRGKNMQRLNIARAGGPEADLDGFFVDPLWSLDSADQVTVRVSNPTSVRHNAVSLGFTGDLLGEAQHVEATLRAGATAGAYRVLEYWVPLELGVRQTHSAYVWRVAGTEPVGTILYLMNVYYDADGNEITPIEEANAVAQWSAPTAAMPTRYAFSDLPPGDAAYVKQCVSVVLPSTLGADVTYGIAGMQTELPEANMVPSISGFYDLNAWRVNATGDTTPGTVEQGGDSLTTAHVLGTEDTETVEFYTDIPHLVPGDDYTFVAQVQKTGGPDVLLSGNDGESGALLTTNNVWTTLRHTFTATKPVQAVKFILQGAPVVGAQVKIRLARCSYADPALPLAVTAGDSDETVWERPKPIFDGWVERWPIRTTAFSSQVTITANDRLKKAGDIRMDSTVRQTLLTDGPVLLIPFDDSPEDSDAVSIMGDWSDESDISQLDPRQTKYGAGAGTFTFGGVVGPSDEDVAKWLQATSTQGYALPVPFTPDYRRTPPAPIIAPPPVPRIPSKQYVRKRYYATWSQTYQADNSQRETPHLFQGISPFATDSVYGNQKSLIGFNWESIRSDLRNYTVTDKKKKTTTTMIVTVHDVSISLCAVDWGRYTSGTAYLGYTVEGTAPSTFDTSQATERVLKVVRWPRNAWRTFGFGAKVAKMFQAGTARGIVIGPGDASTDTYGAFFGATNKTYRPFLTVTYKVTPQKKKKG